MINRGQGTIEYLVIIAVVIVLALGVVVLFLNISDSEEISFSSNKTSNIIGQGGISIIDSITSADGKAILSLQNTSGKNLTILSITPISLQEVAGEEVNCIASFKSGTKENCVLTNVNLVCPCTENEKTTCYYKIKFQTPEGLIKTEKFKLTNVCIDEINEEPETVPNYTVTYFGNENTSGSVPESTSHPSGSTVTVSTNSGNLERTGYTFNGWNTQANGSGDNYTAGSGTFPITNNTTLYADWEEEIETFTVTFDSQEGTTVNPIIGIEEGETIDLPEEPTREDYVFIEWNTSSNGSGTEFTSSTPVIADITVYAQWDEEIIEIICDEPLAGGYFCNGSGTIEDPYGITTVEMLQNIKQDLDANYILLNDIDASETSTWNEPSGFEPIGINTNKFTGSLNGNGYKITDLYINRNSMFVGLFGYAENAEISNLGLENANISSSNHNVGGLIGYQGGGTISNSYFSGNVSGYQSVGGLVGSAGGSVGPVYMYNSYSTGTVTASLYAGGLYGMLNTSGEISNSFSTQTVTGSYSTGLISWVTNGPVFSNLYWYNQTGDSANNCFANSPETCTKIDSDNGGISYFYTSTNSPMSSWDFDNVWDTTDGTTYPHLRNN